MLDLTKSSLWGEHLFQLCENKYKGGGREEERGMVPTHLLMCPSPWSVHKEHVGSICALWRGLPLPLVPWSWSAAQWAGWEANPLLLLYICLPRPIVCTLSIVCTTAPHSISYSLLTLPISISWQKLWMGPWCSAGTKFCSFTPEPSGDEFP